MPSVVQCVALVHQPWSTVPANPSDPLAIAIDRTAREIADRCPIICYATQHPGQPPMQSMAGLGNGSGEIRRVNAPLDRLLTPLKMLDRLGLCSSQRPFSSTGLYQLGYVLKVAQSLRAERCDVVHVHQFPQWSPILRKLNPQLAIVLHMHDNWLARLDRPRTAQRLRDVDLILGVSRHVADQIREAYPAFADVVHHAYAGVDEIFFAAQKPENDRPGKRLLYAAPISREKGIGVLVDAFERVREKLPEAQLVVIGEETEPDLVNQLRAGLTPASRKSIFFKGGLSGPALVDQMLQADIVIAPSIGEEPSGVHLLRAMAVGITPIATKVGAHLELIEPGKTGSLVTPGDAGDLAAAILALFSDRQACRTMGRAARQFTHANFTWEKCIDDLMQHYAEAVAHRKLAVRLQTK